MRLRNLVFAVLTGAACVGVAAASFTPMPNPVAPDGMPATCDLPVSQHMRNVGGSDGAGLCVFTSTQHAARWHNLSQLEGFRKWMESKPGGGWPDKLDQMLNQFCRERSVPVPGYVQHTGGDDAFLDLAIHTDRLPCVTYAGRDDFYRGRIAHMVNLAHIDSTHAAIIDNNRPGNWVWMTRQEFLQRWRDMDGGWAVVFIDPPPPPHPEGKPQAVFGAGPGCSYCSGCKCEAGKCPSGCPVAAPQAFGQCVNGRCQLPTFRPVEPRHVLPFAGVVQPGYHLEQNPADGRWWQVLDGRVIDAPAKPRAEAPAPRPVVAESDLPNYGIDRTKIHKHPQYTIGGPGGVWTIDRDAAHAAISGGSPLADDSDRWHLTAVGDAAFLARFKADVAALPPELRAKLLVQAYPLDHWAVSLYALPPGVCLRKPSPGRVSAEVGCVAVAVYGPDKLAGLLAMPGGPAPRPAPQPDPVKPEPRPTPVPVPPPAPAPDHTPFWLVLIAGALYFLFRKRG